MTAARPRPTVTVVMSVYNGERFLDQAINSIRCQTFRDWEFLIIDDGSRDRTAAILARHAAADSRLRVVHQDNQGLIRSLNSAFSLAGGHFIARMDADDISKPYRLEQQVDFLAAHPAIALVGGAIEIVDEQGGPRHVIRLPREPDRLRYHMLHYGCGLAHPTVCFRRGVLEKTGGFRKPYRHAEDYDLWLRMLEHFELANLGEILLSYRRHAGSISYQHAIQQTLSAFCARTMAKRRLEGIPDPTSDLDLITMATLERLGIPREAIDEEIFAALLYMAEDAIASGLPSTAARFPSLARPHAAAARLRKTSVELNRKALKTPAARQERIRHLALLLRTPSVLWQILKS